MILHLDLDNTLIYSARHEIGDRKKCVEYVGGRAVSFVTERTAELLKMLSDAVLPVPTTTRTTEQYGRIDPALGPFRYALVCNGGVLLVDGVEDQEWYEESLRLAAGSREQCERAAELLRADPGRTLEVRRPGGLFVFTKSTDPERTASVLREKLDSGLVTVATNGAKVYVIPANLDKGTAVRRFREWIAGARGDGGRPPGDGRPSVDRRVFAAGDSLFDLPMLREADVAIAPRELAGMPGLKRDAVVMEGRHVFSEELLEFVLREVSRDSGGVRGQNSVSGQMR